MNTTSTRIAAAAAAPVLALSLLGTAPAHAAPRISDSDFLTGAQVGKVFGDLKKSTPEIESIRYTVRTTGCASQKRVKVKADKFATYMTDKSKHLVQVSIDELRTTAAAKKVFAGARTELKCGFVDLDGGAHFTRTKAPKVGSESLGQLIRWEEEKDEPARMARYVFRKKNRVVTVLVVGDKKPNLAKSRKLAKRAAKAAL